MEPDPNLALAYEKWCALPWAERKKAPLSPALRAFQKEKYRLMALAKQLTPEQVAKIRDDPPPTMTMREAAAYMGVTKNQMATLAYRIPHARPSSCFGEARGIYLFKKEQLDAYQPQYTGQRPLINRPERKRRPRSQDQPALPLPEEQVEEMKMVPVDIRRNPPLVMTIPEAAEYLCVCEKKMRELIGRRRLRHSRAAGRKILVRRQWLDALIDQY